MTDPNTVWWTGVVEDRDDPEQLGRCRVRIFGFHTEDTELLPTSDLPWAIPLQPITSAATSGVGATPVGIVTGTWVMGLFLDGATAQKPLIMGTIAGKPAATTNATKRQEEETNTNGLVKDQNNNILYDGQGNPIPTTNIVTNEADLLKPLTQSELNTLFFAISNRVSNGVLNLEGTNGELGKYQIGISALIDLGYVRRQASDSISASILNDSTNWMGKNGAFSKEKFLLSSTIQEQVMLEFTKDNYDTLIRLGKIQETTDRTVIAGLLTTSHIMGVTNSDKLNKKDLNGIRAKEYFILGNSALGGDASDYLKSFEETGNFLPTIKSTTNAGAQNNEELKNLSGFTDPNKKYPTYDYVGHTDINKLATGDTTHKIFNIKENKKIDKIPLARTSQTWDEPSPAYGAGYPYNQVIETEAGHVIELDSTPGAERIQVFHKTGTYIEIDVNGTMVRKTVGENYEIMDRNNFTYVKGSHNLTVEGKTNIFVRDNASIEIEGSATITGHGDTTVQTAGTLGLISETLLISAKDGLDLVSSGSINIQGKDINLYAKDGSITQKASNDFTMQSGSSGTFSIKGGLALLMDAAVVKTKSGANTIKSLALGILTPPDKKTPDVAAIPVLQREVLSKANYLFDSGEDGSEEYRNNLAKRGILNKNIKSKISNQDSLTRSITITNNNAGLIIPCDCQEIQQFKYFPRSFILSNKDNRIFTLGDLLQDGGLVAQRGLTEQQIVCNLKQIVVNCLDPIKAKYPDMKINSGFRAGTNGSDHGLGAAVDIKFTGTSKSSYKDIADWIIANVPYRQVLLEYMFVQGSNKLISVWIHIAFLTSNGNIVKSSKAPVGTFVNHEAIYSKLVNLA